MHKTATLLKDVTGERLRETAERFLQLAKRKFDVDLDFSEESLVIADVLITLFFKERRNHSYQSIVYLGSYLGQVITQNLGGRWELSDLSVVKIGKVKGVAHPLVRAKKRLANGLEDALVPYYRNLKMNFLGRGDFAENAETTEGAYKILRRDGWDERLLERLLCEEEKRRTREEAADLLGRIGDGRLNDQLISALKSPKGSYYAAIALQGTPDRRALEPLLAILQNRPKTSALRIQAMLALGELKDERAVEFLVSQLHNSDEIICHYAAQAIGKVGGKKALKMLLEIMEGNRQGNRLYTISALEEIGDKEAAPALVAALFDREDEVREAATRAFQYIPDERAVGPLMFLLKDRSSNVRILAGYALAQIGDVRAIEYVKKLLKDPVQKVRIHAASLLSLLQSGRKPEGFCW
ncbi:MAG: HEAT repeat domain-containing protein [Armatimonadetes bacterium]|nr:HEAT repeat domain-containing protein [Armatimonadota bacterium]